MERRIIWTERASSDIEAIVRYIARRDPGAAGVLDWASTTEFRSWCSIQRLARRLPNSVAGGGAS